MIRYLFLEALFSLNRMLYKLLNSYAPPVSTSVVSFCMRIWSIRFSLGRMTPAGPGRAEEPWRKVSTSLAACLPSVMPQTTRLWPDL